MAATVARHSNVHCAKGPLTLPRRYVGNPAVDFLQQPHPGRPELVVQEYARFLLHTSGAYKLPVPLDRVHRYFGFPVHHRQLPPDQQGFTTEELSIYVNADDWPTRQKFTLAHELMEVFFFALKDEHCNPSWMDDDCFVTLCDNKERFCNKGAAELIMPWQLFSRLVEKRSVSLQWAQQVADHCEVSLKATLYRIIATGLAPLVLIMWQFKNSPRELKPRKARTTNQNMEDTIPPKKMRVAEVFAPPTFGNYIPLDKSVPYESAIHRTYLDGIPRSHVEDLDLVGLKGRFFVESRAFTANGERHVMTLIHLETKA